MNTISSFLTSDHRDCDNEFANLENAIASQDWEESKTQLEKFKQRRANSNSIGRKCLP